MNSRNEILHEAQRLVKSGLSIIPIRPDGSKAPAVSQWKPYQAKVVNPGVLPFWFDSGKNGLAVVAGKVSKNVEIIDFDDPASFGDWEAIVKIAGGSGLLEKLPIVMTPSPGFHVYYRCKDGVEGNQKLAQRKGKGPEVMIETRGEGGYVLLPGSHPECHPSNQEYLLLQGNLAEIPTISGEERLLLLESARALNGYIKLHKVGSGPSGKTGSRPGADFNVKADWSEILEPHGWKKAGQRGEVTLWLRPGKKAGISATTNFGGTDLFYNFSTNGHPFGADMGYSKFAAYAFLNHGGDFKAAAADLAKRGYGHPSVSETPQDWPKPLAEDAFLGLSGDIIHTIEPQTEADPAALLIQFLVAFGNVIVKGGEVTFLPRPRKKEGPHYLVEADHHGTNLFTVIVGETSKSRKGTSWGHIRRLFEGVDQEWVKDRIQSGLSSGEGLIWAVRDPIEKLQPIKKSGQVVDYQMVIEDQGVSDKRLLIVESEYSSVLKVLKREGNTLSPTVRNAWDTGDLHILTKNSPAKATGAHISIIGHITRSELLRCLDSTEAANGFGNRFDWVCARRSKVLPEGGKELDLQPLVERLEKAVKFARDSGDVQIKFDQEARKLWYEVYPELSEGKPGLLGAMIARAESQVLRLSCIYALLDCSAVIQKEHLKAALAVWRYCEDSCRYIFGDRLGDPVADRILGALRNSPGGMTRTDINDLFKRNKSATRINKALVLLEKDVLIRLGEPDTGKPGRPAEVWLAV